MYLQIELYLHFYLKQINPFYKDIPVLEDWRHLACESDPSLWQSLTGTNNDRVLDSRTDEPGSDNLIGKEKTDSATGSSCENQEDNEWSGDDEALLELSESTSRRGLVSK